MCPRIRSVSSPAGLDLANTGMASITIEYGACAFAVQLSATADSPAVWQNIPDGRQLCALGLAQLLIAPGATVSLDAGRFAESTGVPVPPRGRYEALVLLNPDGTLDRIPAGSVALP